MKLLLAPEVWAVAVVAAGICGWFFGDLHGAARRLFAQESVDEVQAGKTDSLFSLTIPPKTAGLPRATPRPDMGNLTDQLSAEARVASAVTASKPPLKDGVPSSRHDTFADMPPVDQLRDQARHILQTHNVWAEPDIGERLTESMRTADHGSLGLLNHYRSSIEELQRANVSRDPYRPIGSDEAMPPRLSDVAPVSPTRSLSELACQKEERGQDTQPRSVHIALGQH